MDLQMLWQEAVTAVLVHPLLERHSGLLPLDTVAEINCHSLRLGDIDGSQRVSRHVDLDDAVVIVGNIEVDVRKQVVTELILSRSKDLLDLSNKTPERKIIKVHLEVVVILHSLAEGLHVLLIQDRGAQVLVLLVLPEVYGVWGVDQTVPLQNLSQVFRFVNLSILGLTEWQVVVHVRLAGVVEWSDLVGVEHDVLMLSVLVIFLREEPPQVSSVPVARVPRDVQMLLRADRLRQFSSDGAATNQE
mmetsp:Transcript_29136/g.82144  ORF Transcript_29136/g.82144 Transcript_29136/m.82144 type:complete len:246 (+) Transcript_29136:1274-2011(+)